MPLYLVIDIAKLVNCWELSLRQSAAKPQYEEGSTTIPKGSTSQANGGGSGSPLTGNAEGEDIVSTSVVTQRSS